MKILISKARVIDPKNGIDAISDIFIKDGIISDIGPSLTEYDGLSDIDVIDASGLVAAPGLVDMHCHLREPGFEHKEDIKSGTRAAAMGGFTSVACMPNTYPVADNKTVIDYIINKAKSEGAINVYPIGAITRGLEGEELSPVGEMKLSGVVAISDDPYTVKNADLMRQAMLYSSNFEMPIITHCEDPNLVGNGLVNEGYMSTTMGLNAIPASAEETIVARDIILSKTTGIPIHLALVSSKGSVEIIRIAKSMGIKVTCETCPHYFSITEEAVLGFDTNAKLNPPLRTEKDIEAIIEGLKDGTIDAISTDHSPHHIDEKNCEFDKAAKGISGFETALAVAITYLKRTGEMTISEIITKMSCNPSDILGLGKGELKIGDSADIVIFDPAAKWTVNSEKFISKGKNTPFNKAELFGKVCYVFAGGKKIVNDGELSV